MMIHWKPMLLAVSAVALITMPNERLTAKEARPPKWSRDVLDTFFEDARERLEGARPDYSNAEDNHPATKKVTPTDGQVAFKWSKLIGTETLESEVKRLSATASSKITTASAFKGGGYKDVRRDLSELAVVFAVIAQYDGEPRWKDAAPGLRDTFSHAAASSKVGSDASFREAVACREVLADLVRGGRPTVTRADAAVADWSHVAARQPLMQRINIAHEERLTKWLADPGTFQRNQSDIAHEAQIVAMLADIIHRAAFEFSDDDTYVGYAEDLERAASEASNAAAVGKFEQAREAIGRATNACVNCHDGYRG
jgi:hypothetical protein